MAMSGATVLTTGFCVRNLSIGRVELVKPPVGGRLVAGSCSPSAPRDLPGFVLVLHGRGVDSSADGMGGVVRRLSVLLVPGDSADDTVDVLGAAVKPRPLAEAFGRCPSLTSLNIFQFRSVEFHWAMAGGGSCCGSVSELRWFTFKYSTPGPCLSLNHHRHSQSPLAASV